MPLGQSHWDFRKTCIFGVVNVTPDSFSDGGAFFDTERAVVHGQALAEQGAHVLDVGGESTRPGADVVPADEELGRVIPVIEQLVRTTESVLSIDTYKACVAREAVRAGASVINDISGMELDPGMPEAMAETGASVVLGHLRGEPATMNRNIAFVDVVSEVTDELRARVRRAIQAGVAAERIWVDPGIGFGKSADQSLELLRATGRLREALGYPVLVGPSRKSFIGAVTGEPADRRLMGTASSAAAAIVAGADGVRLHDVGLLASAVRVADAIRRGRA